MFGHVTTTTERGKRRMIADVIMIPIARSHTIINLLLLTVSCFERSPSCSTTVATVSSILRCFLVPPVRFVCIIQVYFVTAYTTVIEVVYHNITSRLLSDAEQLLHVTSEKKFFSAIFFSLKKNKINFQTKLLLLGGCRDFPKRIQIYKTSG